MLKIVAPLNAVDDVNPLIDAGASELYCGVLTRKWLRKYTPVVSPNRREWRDANLGSFDELEEVVKSAHSRDVSVALTLNAQYFTEKQVPDLKRYVKKAVGTGVDAFFVSDIGAICLIREIDDSVGVHLSSVAATFNSSAAKFYGKLGAGRIILPRHLRLKEIKEVVKSNSGLEFEAFVMYNRCPNVDGLCTFLHGSAEYGLGTNGCALLYDIEEFPKDEGVRRNVKNIQTWTHTPDGFVTNLAIQCGLCALYDFERWGLHAIKIIGRGKPLWMKLVGVKLALQFVDLLKKNPSKKRFMSVVRKKVENDLIDDHPRFCNALNCHYPELIRWNMPYF